MTTQVSTRREFLSKTSLAAVGTVVGARALYADTPIGIPVSSPLPAQAFLAYATSPSTLQTLALRAMDAAKDAGAQYADVRVAEQHVLMPELDRVILRTHFGFGVRALMDGVWGFAYGRSPNVDAIARCAQDAVAAGRLAARLNSGTDAASQDWAPAP